MSKLKKVLLMCTAYVLVAALAIGGTVAYLQDSDSDVNVMTLGNVKIEQHEYQRAEGVAHNEGEPGAGNGVKEGALVPFVQGQALYPAVPKNNAGGDYTAEMDTANLFFWGDYVYSGTAGNGLWDDSKLSNVMDKMVFVENTGKSDAYIRTVIAFECPEGITIGEPSQGAEIMINTNIGTYDWDDVGYITVDGVRYAVMTATYKKVLAPGNQSHPSLLQVVMTHHATNEDVALLGDTYEILVVSQAVQAAGFADAETALNAGFGDITTTNHPWTNTTISSEVGITEAGTYNLEGDVYTIDSAYFHTQKVDAPVTINGNGATVEGIATSVDAFQWEGGTIPAMSAIFSSADGSKVTVNDLKFTGTMSAIMLGHYVNSSSNWYNTELNNVDVIGTEVVSLSAGVSPAVAVYGKAVLNNCNVYGTTLSELDTDPMWPVYDLALTNYTTTTLNNSKVGSIYMWSHANVTIADGSEVDEMYTALITGTVTVKSGAHVGTINVDYAERGLSKYATANYFKKIVVEDGANVDAIVYNGTTYTVAEWNAYVASL